MRDHIVTCVGSVVRSGLLADCSRKKASRTAHTAANRTQAFTLAELLVTTGVLVLLVFLASQLFNSAATVTTLGHKRMDAEAQVRQLLDRMAIDFAQMVKRSDVDYYVKSNPLGIIAGLRTVLQPGNDRIAFYSAVPGYYPTSNYQSPVSLVAYRVNSLSTSSSYNKTERMGKGLLWNAAQVTPAPVVFVPIPVASPLPSRELPSPTPNPLPTPAWPEASSATTSWSDSEVIGPQVFRFEYYYLLKGQGVTLPAVFSDTPFDTRTGHTNLSGMQDVSAIVVDIAVIDPKSKALLDTVDPTGAKLARLNGADGSPPLLVDFAVSMTPGQLLTQWRAALDANTVGLPLRAISGVRVYERFIYLSPGL